MKYIIFYLFIFFSFSLHGQFYSPIKVELNSGEVIGTNYAYLYYASFKGAVVRIHDENGPVLKAKDVKKIEGINQDGDSLYFETIDFRASKIWLRRTFKSERIEIFTESMTQRNIGTGASFTWKLDYYRKDDGEIKPAKYQFMKHDLQDNAESMKYLKKANTAKIAQLILYGAGVGFLINGIAQFANEDPPPPGGSTSSSPSVSPSLILGVGCFLVPLIINPSKQDNFIKSLKVYE